MKRYDRAYFDRWYRDPRHRVRTAAALRREVAMVVGIAEHVLERPLRSVLDVGCGEGAWQPVLRRLRPAARYTGVEPSEYAVRRFGARRGIVRGSLATLDEALPREPVDLVLCSDVLHYVRAAELERGLAQLRPRIAGVAYLPLLTSADDFDGDRRGWLRRSPSWYRDLFARHDLVSCGMSCWVGGTRVLGAMEG